jgi:hypothetical protein
MLSKEIVTECPVCEKYRRLNQNYCKVCGVELAPGYAKFIKTVTPYLRGEKYCGACGRELIERLCPNCDVNVKKNIK